MLVVLVFLRCVELQVIGATRAIVLSGSVIPVVGVSADVLQGQRIADVPGNRCVCRLLVKEFVVQTI